MHLFFQYEIVVNHGRLLRIYSKIFPYDIVGIRRIFHRMKRQAKAKIQFQIIFSHQLEIFWHVAKFISLENLLCTPINILQSRR